MAQIEPTGYKPKKRPPNYTRPDARPEQQPKRTPTQTVTPSSPTSTMPAWLGNVSNWMQQQLGQIPVGGAPSPYQPTQPSLTPNTLTGGRGSGLPNAQAWQNFINQQTKPWSGPWLNPSFNPNFDAANLFNPSDVPQAPQPPRPGGRGMMLPYGIGIQQPPEVPLDDFYFRHPGTPELPPLPAPDYGGGGGGYGYGYRRRRGGGGGGYSRQPYQPYQSQQFAAEENMPAWYRGLANWTIG